jgi:hypothetical protein
MAQGKAIPEVVQWIIIRLSTMFSAEEISMYTDVGTRKVSGIIAHFNRTGDIILSCRSKRQVHKTLCDYDIEVCSTLPLPMALLTDHCYTQHLLATLSHTPDLYLEELRQDLVQRCGVSVSESTIWRTLIKGGYTMKKVCNQ